MSLLGIDVGTTACKVVAFAPDGRVLASAAAEYPLAMPAPGRLELDPDRVWNEVAGCVRAVNATVAADPVVAVAVSSQGEAVVPVGPGGQVLAPSPVTADTRGVAKVAELERILGREWLARTTGQPPHPMFTVAKLAWWARHDPDLVRRAWKFLCYGDFVSLRLGGEPAIDFSMAARTMAFDIRALAWQPDVLAAAGIAEGQMPAAVAPGSPIGRVSPRVAADLGFVGSPVIAAGGHDQPCGALGAGVAGAGEAMFAIGTTVCLAPVFPAIREELLGFGYPCYPHVAAGRFVTLAGNFTGGSLLRWYRDRFAGEERRLAEAAGRDVYDLIVEEAGDEPSPLLVLPHFAGAGAPHNDPGSMGAVVGLEFSTTRGQVIRGLLEGVMMEMALNRELLGRAGVAVDGVVAVGGGARSDRWLQIAADVLDVPVRRSRQREAAAWGAAMLAAAAGGVAVDEGDGAGAEPFLPDPGRAGYYRERMAAYRALHGALAPVYRAM